MKFSIEQRDFQTALSIVQKGLSGKNLMEVLKGIHIEAVDQMLHITTNNLELGILTKVPARVDEEGKVLIDGRILSDIVRKLSNETLHVNVTKDQVVNIKTSRSEFNIMAMVNDRFPLVQEYETKDYQMVNSALFSEMIHKTYFAASQDEARGVLTGELFEVDEDSVMMVAIDGFRLAVKKIATNLDLEPRRAVIPKNTLTEIQRLSEGLSEIGILFEQRAVSFLIGDTVLNSKLLEGEFINYKQIIPSDFATTIKINVRAFSEALDRASIISNNKLVVLNIASDMLRLSSRNAEVGNLKEDIAVEFSGKELEIAFNSRYFTDVFRHIEDEEVYLKFNTNISPCVVEPESDSDYTYLLLPVRI